MEYPYNLTEEEAIRLIEQIYHSQYDPTRETFDVYDQLLACEVIAESGILETTLYDNSLDKQQDIQTKESVNVSGNDNVNGGCKTNVNTELTQSKLEAIEKLKACRANTSPFIIESLLKQLFSNSTTKAGHWLFVAQQWTPKRINLVITEMTKAHQNGFQTIHNPAAYFTHLIKFRARRKSLKKKRSKYA